MLEVYSKNITVAETASVPFNSLALDKGSEQLEGSSTVVLNRCGIYKVDVHAVATAAAAGDVSLQLVKDGVPVAQAISTATIATATTESVPLSFSTLVQVSRSNTPSVCSAPTNLTLLNQGIEATFSVVDLVVSRWQL